MKTYEEIQAMNDDQFRRYERWEILKPCLWLVGTILYVIVGTIWLNSTLPVNL